jgi:hypothetical protein
MRRVAFVLFTIVAAASLALSLAVVVLWVRSYRPTGPLRTVDSIDLRREEPMYWVTSGKGRLALCRQVGKNWDYPLREFKVLDIVRFGGLWGDRSMLWNLVVPHWLVAATAAVPPLIWLLLLRRIRRARKLARRGLCPKCGYDLRATPDRCPECGALPALVVTQVRAADHEMSRPSAPARSAD